MTAFIDHPALKPGQWRVVPDGAGVVLVRCERRPDPDDVCEDIIEQWQERYYCRGRSVYRDAAIHAYDDRQVCSLLRASGGPLEATPETLADVIDHEMRKIKNVAFRRA